MQCKSGGKVGDQQNGRRRSTVSPAISTPSLCVLKTVLCTLHATQGADVKKTDTTPPIGLRISISHHVDHTSPYIPCFLPFPLFVRPDWKLGRISVRARQCVDKSTITFPCYFWVSARRRQVIGVHNITV